jgi:pimeloyl-ACP methyl ester carboxylesterase
VYVLKYTLMSLRRPADVGTTAAVARDGGSDVGTTATVARDGGSADEAAATTHNATLHGAVRTTRLTMTIAAGSFTGTFYQPLRTHADEQPSEETKAGGAPPSAAPEAKAGGEAASSVTSPAPVVILLHGFPDLPEPSFQALATHLASRVGVTCLVPHLRGYEQSSVQPGGPARTGYHMCDLAEDVLAWIVELEARGLLASARGVVLVGHDWGSLVAQATEALARTNSGRGGRPNRILGMVLMAVPPTPRTLRRAEVAAVLRVLPVQLYYSFYIFMFQLPYLPEYLVGRRSFVAWLWKRWSPGMDAARATARGESVARHLRLGGSPPAGGSGGGGGTGSACDEQYVSSVSASSDGGATTRPRGGSSSGSGSSISSVTAAIGYYRCLFNPFCSATYRSLGLLRSGHEAPTMALCGLNDHCMHPAFFQAACAASGVRCVNVSDAGHWVHLEQPALVHDHIASFVSSVALLR